ncbi:MAG: hypothetical protein ABFD96_01680, partial [Armatimonadia bacterium]
ILLDSGKPYVQLHVCSDWQATCQEHLHATANHMSCQALCACSFGWDECPLPARSRAIVKTYPDICRAGIAACLAYTFVKGLLSNVPCDGAAVRW